MRNSLTNSILSGLLVIVLAVIVSFGIFYAYGKSTVVEYAVNTITLNPSKDIQSGQYYSGNDDYASTNTFGGYIRTWAVSPDFTRQVFAKANVEITDGDLIASPITLQSAPTGLAYIVQVQASTDTSVAVALVNAAVSTFKDRTDALNAQSEQKLQFTVSSSSTDIIKHDNSRVLLRVIAPLIGLFAGIFIVVVRETLRRTRRS